MSEYVNIPVITDPDALAQDSFDYLETKSPDWKPHDGQLDTWLIAATARMIAVVNGTVSDVDTSIFRFLGANIFQIPPEEALSAVVNSTWNVSDTAGHTIQAGTAIGIPTSGGELIAFEVKETFVIPNGSNKAEHIPLIAVVPGAEGSGLGAKGTALTLLDQIAYVNSVTLEESTSGGQDAEEDSVYLDRLVGEIRLLAPRPIIPNDFSELARSIPGVHRALALNGYNPENGLFTNERTVAVAVVDEFGEECSEPIKKQVETLLLSKREVNFIIRMLAITYTSISVEWEAKKWKEWNSEDVTKRVNEALAIFLSSAKWGQPPFGDDTQWYLREKVKINDIIAVIGNVQGVEDVLSVKLKKTGGAFEAVDITLPGVAPLPRPGEMKGVVV